MLIDIFNNLSHQFFVGKLNWVAPRRPAFLLDVSSRTLGRVVCDPELKVSRGGVPMDKKTSAICVSASLRANCVCHAKKGDPSVSNH